MGLQKSFMLISSEKKTQIDTMSWHNATSVNEPNVHQKPFITTVALRCLATSKSTRRCIIACTFSKTWHRPFWFSGYKHSFNIFRYGSRTIKIGQQMRKYTLNCWAEKEEEEEKETIKLLKKRALESIQPGTFWSENFCDITPCATRTIYRNYLTDGRTD